MSDIEITEVENGYIVRVMSFMGKTRVFTSFAEVIEFLKDYYSIKEDI